MEDEEDAFAEEEDDEDAFAEIVGGDGRGKPCGSGEDEFEEVPESAPVSRVLAVAHWFFLRWRGDKKPVGGIQSAVVVFAPGTPPPSSPAPVPPPFLPPKALQATSSAIESSSKYHKLSSS